ncbi:MAG: WYL domain-containing protein [Bacteroidales bacterium]|jgi:predicted DNA-binding transcriptional regulator YafY|nr:WYL domain-containing protein [Bacteroidales bacterium]
MNNNFCLKQLATCVWILEELRKSGDIGLTLAQLDIMLRDRTKGKEGLSRSSLTRRRKEIKLLFNINVESPDKKHYYIMNKEQLALDTLANDLLASVQEYLFLDSYRDLGSLIQPMQINNGMEFLHVIGDALRSKNKLKIRYQKFSDTESYEAIVHPYCLKASMGRWYLFGHKENNSQGLDVQSFALDRTVYIKPLKETFSMNKEFNPETYFKDSFGTWVEKEKYPVCDLTIAVKPDVASYLRTLPLHHSQKEMSSPTSNDKTFFTFHISPTPDFIGELKRWGDGVEIIEQKKFN